MAKLAQWTLNDPTVLVRVWDNSGNKNHGDFGTVKPEVVQDSPNGSRAMKWNGSNVTLPDVTGVAAISYWIKKTSGTFNNVVPSDSTWHLYVVSNGVQYLDGTAQTGSVTVSTAYSNLRTTISGGSGFSLSDIILYDAALTTQDIQNIMKVKTTLSKSHKLSTKEFVEDDSISKVSISKNGILTSKELHVDSEAAGTAFEKTGNLTTKSITEQ